MVSLKLRTRADIARCQEKRDWKMKNINLKSHIQLLCYFCHAGVDLKRGINMESIFVAMKVK